MLPAKDFKGQKATITMTELRTTPGDVIEHVKAGMQISITKNGKVIALLLPVNYDNETTIIKSDGSIAGPIPLTLRNVF